MPSSSRDKNVPCIVFPEIASIFSGDNEYRDRIRVAPTSTLRITSVRENPDPVPVLKEDKTMRSILIASALSLTLLGTAACSGLNHTEQRALSGGAIGAAGGAAIGALTGGSAVTGALIGGAGGAAAGALTADRDFR